MTPTATGPVAPTAPARPSDALSAQTLKDMLYSMLLIRRFEERTMQNYQQAHIGGFCHIYIGQEATAVGSIGAALPDDPLITAYRDHGHALARGMHPNYAMAEMFGKLTGCAKGKGGSMHFFDRPHAMFGGHAIVGGQCPMGLGLAWGIQYNRENKVCLCYLGDGALNQGAFLESLNFAAVFNLPILFVLENNGYSMGTDIARGTAMAHELAAKAEANGIRYAECDGQDLLATYDCFAREIARTRGARPINFNERTNRRETLPTYRREGRTPGPAFINVKTYRYQGHSMSDPQKYRNKDEVESRGGGKDSPVDCINRLVNHIIDRGYANQSVIDSLDDRAKAAANEAVRFAKDSPETPLSELYTDVYSQPFGPFLQGAQPDIVTNPECK